ncbi:MAG: ABC transporter ATP-binding protein [Syntrophomonas sp.]|nr:ABC transporter ATP-binding protein [Syntrophomonas sp.]
MKPVIVENLSYSYQAERAKVIRNISFEASKRELLVFTGLSGCGKSTLGYCLSGIIPHCWPGAMSGNVLINGKSTREFSLARLALEVGLVFQNPDNQLFSPTVEDEIAFGPENMCLPPVTIRERVDYVIDLLEINVLREANPYLLSGGEKHLVALAAVLALDPPVLVLDEVMSQLDYGGKKKVADALKKLRYEGKTIIAVEHDLEALAFADRIITMTPEGYLFD